MTETFKEYWDKLPEGKLKTPIKASIEMMSLNGVKVSSIWVPCEIVAKFKQEGKVIQFGNDDKVPEKYKGQRMPVHHTHKIEVFF